MGLVAIAAVAAGFSTTYFIPIARAAFPGPLVAHVHGLLFMAWVALMLVQPMLVRQRRSRFHRKLGWVALPLAAAMAVSGLGVGLFAVSRDRAAGGGDFAYSQLPGVAAAMIVFAAYVSIAVAARKRPDWHKRMMLLATVAVLWPAWFRFRHFLPFVPHPQDHPRGRRVGLAHPCGDGAGPPSIRRNPPGLSDLRLAAHRRARLRNPLLRHARMAGIGRCDLSGARLKDARRPQWGGKRRSVVEAEGDLAHEVPRGQAESSERLPWVDSGHYLCRDSRERPHLPT